MIAKLKSGDFIRFEMEYFGKVVISYWLIAKMGRSKNHRCFLRLVADPARFYSRPPGESWEPTERELLRYIEFGNASIVTDERDLLMCLGHV